MRTRAPERGARAVSDPDGAFWRRPFWSAAVGGAQLSLVLIALTVTDTGAAEVTVTNQSALNSAIAAARSGDEVILADGVWSDTHLLLDKPGTVQTFSKPQMNLTRNERRT
jgi:hypothetical protein